jgi:hypothetical protein
MVFFQFHPILHFSKKEQHINDDNNTHFNYQIKIYLFKITQKCILISINNFYKKKIICEFCNINKKLIYYELPGQNKTVK